MSTKKVVVDTDCHRGKLFKVSESGGRYYIHSVQVGILSDSTTKIGESRSLEDALSIIKASAGGSVRNMKVSDW